MAREFSEKWETVRSRHHEILRAAIEQYNGFIFQIIGDAFCAAFDKAADALNAAIEAQRGLQREAWGEPVIRVRMGIHTGEAETDGREYRGYLTLSLVQRLMSAGHGGQILVSAATEILLRDQLPKDLDLRDMGKHSFKDISQALHVFQVIAPGLQTEFPPLRTLDIRPHNLPPQLTSFVGREKELSDLRKLLQHAHMLTLIGPGGTGKTRLAIQAASESLAEYPDGVWLVELASTLDPLLVPRTAAIVIGLRDEPQRPVIDMLCDYLHEKKMLIILDNCEHLVDACARMADRILHAASDTRILASSREALGIGGEVTYRVPSLGLPDPSHLPPVESLDQYEAVKLFIDRATNAVPDFVVTNENAPALAQICYRLDGIPLAIELAAAKIRALSIEQIARRLDDRFRLLTGGSRTALERHQTLRAAIDWSYNLLPPAEQVLFRRLSVFVGGWTLEAAELVCSGETLKSGDVLDFIEQLIHKSLVSREDDHGESRYQMLETMRQYANEKLVEAKESDALRDRHLEYFLTLVETAEPHLTRPEQLEWLAQLQADHENLRLALVWALSKDVAEPSLRFCTALKWFWEFRCYWLEGHEWVKRALAKPAQSEDLGYKKARAGALTTRAELEWQLGNFEQVSLCAQESLALASELLDRKDIAIAQFHAGVAVFHVGDNGQARSLMEQSLAEFQALNDLFWQTYVYPFLGYILARQGELTFQEVALKYLELARQAGERWALAAALSNNAYWLTFNNRIDEAREYAEESARYTKQIGSTDNGSSFVLAVIAWISGDTEKAGSIYKEMEERYRMLGDKGKRANCLKNLGLLAMEEGELDRANTYLEEALKLTQAAGNKVFTTLCLVELSNLFYLRREIDEFKRKLRESFSFTSSLDNYHKVYFLMTIIGSLYLQNPGISTRLLGAIDCYVVKDGFYSPIDKRYCIRGEAHARKSLGDAAFESTFAEGQKMSLDEALDLTLKAVEEM